VKRVGVVGTIVWDTIYGRDPAQGPVEEWGGIAYALAALDASLGDDWEFVPLIKVGRDLAPRAATFLRDLRHAVPNARFIEVPEPTNRVTLRYDAAGRRSEQLRGGVPGWSWPELGPLVRDLDAMYVNFIAGWELTLDTARLLRRGFRGPLYADLHSLFLGCAPDGTRVLQRLSADLDWCTCFDTIQVNEDEFSQLGPDPLVVAARVLAAGVGTLIVTLGPKGAVYFVAAPGAGSQRGGPIRSARLSLEPGDRAPTGGGDPTGCGDVFGAVTFASLLQGLPLEAALRHANRLAARKVLFRGATGLRDHLLGRLATR
jgi:sugar/nucleoside kinase (ribokinase family)